MTIGSRRRITRQTLFAVIPEYRDAESSEAAERMFERDKAEILELGIPLGTEVDSWDSSIVHYRVDAAHGADTALDLTPDEYTVALAASRAWDEAAAGGAARRVRAKLLSLGYQADPDLARRTPRGSVESLAVLTPLMEAVSRSRSVGFRYRAADGRLAERRIDPWIVGVHGGHWYVVGHDRDRDAQRVFRASRIESFPKLGGEIRQHAPEGLDLATVLRGSATVEEPQEVRLRVEPYKALALRDRAGAALEATEVTLPAMEQDRARRSVLSESRWVTLLAPGPWREEVAEALGAVVAVHEGEDPERRQRLVEESVPRRSRKVRASTSGIDQVSRLIAEAAYVMSRDGAELSVMAAEFGITEQQLITDLQVLFVCGDLGTGWEDFIEAEWEGGIVRVRNADALRRPLRLSATETTALLAGLGALGPAAGPEREVVEELRRKLSATLEDPRTAADPVSEPARAEVVPAPARREDAVLEAVHRALADGAPLVIRYSPPDRPGTTVRRIHPLALETASGRAYLRADCELAGAERTFRLDRIVQTDADPASATANRSDPGEEDAIGESRTSLRDRLPGGTVWLRLDPPAAWLAESFEAAEVRDLPEGGILARLEHPVLAALIDGVVEGAGAAEVLSPPSLRDLIVTIAGSAAERHHGAGGDTL